MKAMEFSKQFHKKQLTVEGFNRLLRQGNEFEAVFLKNHDEFRQRMVERGGPFATNKGINDGNGFNNDLHADGYMDTTSIGGRTTYAWEISTSPYESSSYQAMKQEAAKRIELMKHAGDGVFHGCSSSTHLHNTVAYASLPDEQGWTSTVRLVDDLPIDAMYKHIGHVLVAFMPVLKWFSMTAPRGARSAHGNRYDMCDGDQLFAWYEQGATTPPRQFGRDSYFRTHNDGSNVFHWENRMMDACASPIVLASWFALNRAISMWAFDFATNGFTFECTSQDKFNSREAMAYHRQGWKQVNRKYIEERWEVLKSYLYKYFKKANSLEAIDMLDKLIEKPVPQYLEEHNLEFSYEMTQIDKLFNVRNRPGNEELRKKYLDAIKAFKAPMADNLAGFHKNIAAVLGVEEKNTVSLYQMFKRENVDIEFMGGRLVYMGD